MHAYISMRRHTITRYHTRNNIIARSKSNILGRDLKEWAFSVSTGLLWRIYPLSVLSVHSINFYCSPLTHCSSCRDWSTRSLGDCKSVDSTRCVHHPHSLHSITMGIVCTSSTAICTCSCLAINTYHIHVHVVVNLEGENVCASIGNENFANTLLYMLVGVACCKFLKKFFFWVDVCIYTVRVQNLKFVITIIHVCSTYSVRVYLQFFL